jgi:hypothetical protein
LCTGGLEKILEVLNNNSAIGSVSSSLQAFNELEPEKPLKKLRFPSKKKILYLKNGEEAFEKIFLRSCSLSGLIFRKDLINFDKAISGVKSQYPQMFIMGEAAKKADVIYLSDPLMKLRLEEVKRWDYESDFMSEAIFSILEELTKNEKWGPDVRKKIIKKRIVAAYGPLYSAKLKNWSSFLKTVKGLLSVKEYRRDYFFFSMVIAIGILGCNGINIVRKIWKGPTGADVIS